MIASTVANISVRGVPALGISEPSTICRIEREGNSVLVTELKANNGRSVTNAIETIAAFVCTTFGIAPEKLSLMEQYEGRRRVDLVTFGRIITYPITFESPHWRVLPAGIVLAMEQQGFTIEGE